MREILFRGKCTDTGSWYEGQYIHLHKTTYCFNSDYAKHPDNDIHQIVFERMTDWGLPNQHFRADVVPETVGQYTGLTDKNGKRIFEGDIVDCWSEGVNAKGTVQQRKDGLWIIYPAWQKTIMWGLCPDAYSQTTVEVIGNIHDNPELVEEPGK